MELFSKVMKWEMILMCRRMSTSGNRMALNCQMCLNNECLHFAFGAGKLHKSAATTCTFCKAAQNSIDC